MYKLNNKIITRWAGKEIKGKIIEVIYKDFYRILLKNGFVACRYDADIENAEEPQE